MRVAEFGDVVALAAVAEQGVRPGVVQLAVVEDDEAGIAHQVGPHELVAGGVPELIDDQIVGLRQVPRHEVVRPPQLEAIQPEATAPLLVRIGGFPAVALRPMRPDRVVDENVDLV